MTAEGGKGSERKRFFHEELEDSILEASLENEDSFLFQQPDANGAQPKEDDEIEKIKNVIPDLTYSQASNLLKRAEAVDLHGERISTAVDLYFESSPTNYKSSHPSSVQKAMQPSPAHSTTESPKPLNMSITTPTKRKKALEGSSHKKRKHTIEWRRFIGALQVNALATRPTTKPLQYGTKLEIIKNLSDNPASRLYTSNGKKKASMANYVRLFHPDSRREVGRVPENIAQILFPLADTDELEFEATMVFCDNKRLSVGDTFIVQLDCFLTSLIFDKTEVRGENKFSQEKRSFSQAVVESDDELEMRSRRLALLALFDQVHMRPHVDGVDIITNSSEKEVIDLEDDSTGEDIDSITNKDHTIQNTQIQQDVLDLKQLKSFYKSALSTESSKILPETTPPPEVFKLDLRPYQKQGLTWMLRREREFDLSPSVGSAEDVDGNMMNPLWKQFSWPRDLSWTTQRLEVQQTIQKSEAQLFYANLHTGEFSETKPVIKSMLKGGILADEMGLGKTISVLAMISMVPFDVKYDEKRRIEENDDVVITDQVFLNGNIVGSKPYASKTTLIIVPMSLLSQWQQEFDKACRDPSMRCEIYYGSNISNLKTLLTRTKTPPAVLLTTYGTVQNEWSRSLSQSNTGLFSVEFFRIVIDEGHTIRNRSTRTSKSMMDLTSSRRWVLTGTPIINRLDDLYSLVKFMKLEPWSQVGYWKTFVSEPFEKKDYKQAFDVVSSILEPVLLRRTKQMRGADGKPLVELPPKEVTIEKVKFNEYEDKLYKYFLNRAENSVKEGLARGDLLKKYSTILVHILRLRQVCCHVNLLGSQDENDEDLAERKGFTENVNVSNLIGQNDKPSGFTDNEFKIVLNDINDKFPSDDSLRGLECSICTSEPIDPVTQVLFTECAHAFCENCILEYIKFQGEKNQKPKCPNCRHEIDLKRLLSVKESGGKLSITLYDNSSRSSKICALLKDLKRLQEACPGEQIVVFSQFSSYLDILEAELSSSFSSSSAKIYKFDGRLSLKDRTRVLNDFGVKDLTRLKILLLSLKAGGVGLNLTCASRAYMMDPWWSPSLEDQAIDRIHRIGQINNVKVTRFIMEHSVEEKMLRIQDRKRSLGEAVDADEEERRKRRIEEIQMLFE